jgi:diaminopimelate epimerase
MTEDVIMHGAGNKFLIHLGDQDPSALLKNLQDADGLLILSHNDDSDFYMRIFNADGSEAQQCGNGLRCAALHAFRSRLVKGREITIRTLAGLNKCLVHPERNEVEVTIGFPEVGASSCCVDQNKMTGLPVLEFISFGNPNSVLWTEEDPVEVRQAYGALVTQHECFSEGINLHVARRDTTNHATVASWERGVGPTLASGTGGASVFVASKHTSPFVVTSAGGSLAYSYADDGQIVMAGSATYD